MECHNTEGTYECRCKFGLDGSSSSICSDVDECLDKADQCHYNAQCENYVGGWDCKCKRGYLGNGFECKNMNECTFGNGEFNHCG